MASFKYDRMIIYGTFAGITIGVNMLGMSLVRIIYGNTDFSFYIKTNTLAEFILAVNDKKNVFFITSNPEKEPILETIKKDYGDYNKYVSVEQRAR
ncbi:MAG: hypothetical protein ACP5N3_05995 [Candidatus Nanoarchaeia archaeon]